jgi:hypothetical protein
MNTYLRTELERFLRAVVERVFPDSVDRVAKRLESVS